MTSTRGAPWEFSFSPKWWRQRPLVIIAPAVFADIELTGRVVMVGRSRRVAPTLVLGTCVLNHIECTGSSTKDTLTDAEIVAHSIVMRSGKLSIGVDHAWAWRLARHLHIFRRTP